MSHTQPADILRTYVNDMIAVERDVYNAVTGQSEDENVHRHPEVAALISAIATASQNRLASLEVASERLKGTLGATIKEAVAAATGTLAGLYGKMRKHPVSKMLRDDHVALSLCATAYGMLYTTALYFDDEDLSVTSLEHLNGITPQIKKLTSLLPAVVARELAADHPGSPEAAAIAQEAIEAAWSEPVQL